MFLHELYLARRSSHSQYLSYTYWNTEWKLKALNWSSIKHWELRLVWFNLITLRAWGFSPRIYSTLGERRAGLHVHNITGLCGHGRKWQGTRLITDRSYIKFDVTIYSIASDLWRQLPDSLFSRHMRTSSFSTFTFCSSPLTLSSHVLPGAASLIPPVWCQGMVQRLSYIKASCVYVQSSTLFFFCCC